MNGCHSWQLSLPLGIVRAYKPMYVCTSSLLVSYRTLALHCNFAIAAGDTQLKLRGSRLHSRNKARPFRCTLRPRAQPTANLS